MSKADSRRRFELDGLAIASYLDQSRIEACCLSTEVALLIVVLVGLETLWCSELGP
jgi:hypothetical protein